MPDGMAPCGVPFPLKLSQRRDERLHIRQQSQIFLAPRTGSRFSAAPGRQKQAVGNAPGNDTGKSAIEAGGPWPHHIRWPRPAGGLHFGQPPLSSARRAKSGAAKPLRQSLQTQYATTTPPLLAYIELMPPVVVMTISRKLHLFRISSDTYLARSKQAQWSMTQIFLEIS